MTIACTRTASTSSASNTASYTFSAVALGAADADRHIIVTIAGSKGTSPPSVSGVTVAGIAASIVGQVGHDGGTQTAYSAIVIAAVPTGTTGTIVVTLSGGNAQNCGIAVYRVTGVDPTAYATATDTVDPTSATISTPAGGLIIGVSGDGGASATCSWTNLTEDIDAQTESGLAYRSSAFDVFGSAQTNLSITADWTVSSANALTLASFQPASSAATGTAAQSLAALAQAAAGKEEITGSVGQSLAALAQAVAGGMTTGATGTAAQTLARLMQAAGGGEKIAGQAAQALARLALAAAGQERIAGAAGQILAPLTQATAALARMTGTAAQGLAAAGHAALGGERIAGTAAQMLAGLAAQAAAGLRLSGSVGQDLAALGQAAGGTLRLAGQAAALLPRLAQAIAGAITGAGKMTARLRLAARLQSSVTAAAAIDATLEREGLTARIEVTAALGGEIDIGEG